MLAQERGRQAVSQFPVFQATEPKCEAGLERETSVSGARRPLRACPHSFIKRRIQRIFCRLFPSCLKRLFQNETYCEVFHDFNIFPRALLDAKIRIYEIMRLNDDKGLFRSANILQIADVIRRVVFLLCFQTIVRRETSKMCRRLFGHFSFHNQNNSTSSQVFSVNG